MLRKCTLTLLLALLALVPVVLLGTGSIRADDRDHDRDNDRNGGAVRLLATIPIPTTLNPLHGWDISWLDAATQLLYVADRSNKSVDVFDARTNTFVRAIKGGFAGVAFNKTTGAANNDISGPNGVVTSGHFLFVTDANSRVVSIDLSNHDQIVSDVTTASADPLRADELAFDPRDGLLLVVNNADDPPFASLIKVNNGALTTNSRDCGPSSPPPCRITFKNFGPNRDTATNGAEQPVWEPKSRRFFISIPEVNGVASDGAVAKINPQTGAVEATFRVKFCQPAGLTVGPQQDLLLGCSVVFDSNPAGAQPWSPTDPFTAAPTHVIMDATTGAINRVIAGVGGSDEVWFNSGDRRYYTASRNNPGGPVLGVIDADGQSLVQVVPTLNVAGKNCTLNPLNCTAAFPAGTAHSVAVDPYNNHALVPLAANNVFPNCSNGCVAVFGTSRNQDQD